MMHSRYRRIKRVVSIVAHIEEDIKEDIEVDMGMVTSVYKKEEEVDPPHVSIAVRLVMSHNFTPNHELYVHIVTQVDIGGHPPFPIDSK
jgi:hypothetical protein